MIRTLGRQYDSDVIGQCRQDTVRLQCVVYVPAEKRQAMDRLMVEQGNCWTGGSGCNGKQSPLVKYDFLGSQDRIRALDRSLTATLAAIEAKFYTFVSS